jgi:predicted amidohydrolase YtcJ
MRPTRRTVVMSDVSDSPREASEAHPIDNEEKGKGSGEGAGLSRREFLAGAAAASAAGVLGVPSIAAAAGPSMPLQVNERFDGSDLIFVNGRIHTMDESGTIARAATVRNGRFVSVGNGARAGGPGTSTINLQGRTVIPGIIDNHNHIVLMGNRPGFHAPLENANSIAQVQETLAARAADVPAGEWITTIGGFAINQFAESRFPTKDELDDAVPDHPVFLSQSFSGPSATNSAGAAILSANGVNVEADGGIASGGAGDTGEALLYLRQTLLTPETRRRGALDAMTYGAALGVTTHLDQGAFQETGQPSDGAAHEDNYTMHDPFLELYRTGEIGTRLRINFLNLEEDTDTPMLVERLRNAFPFFGNDLVRTGGIGEFTAGDFIALFLGNPGPAWEAGTFRVAEAGWRNENHSLTANDFGPIIDHWEEVNAQVPITDLRWVIAHVPFITQEYVEKCNNLGVGLSLTGWRYLTGSSAQNGPPFRMIVDSGNNVGMSSDGMQIAPMNPWLHMFYATTGINSSGDLINDGQQITREEVLRLYTADNAWFIGEDDLGSIEVGKHADLVVLSDDYFSVSDDGMKDLHSVLTVVGGRVVHDAGVV